MSRTLTLPALRPGLAVPAVAAHLPPLPGRGARRDGLTPAQRTAMVGAILCAHGAALWGVMQIREVRDAVAEVAPMFVSLLAPDRPAERPPEPVRLPPPPPQAAPTRIVKPPPPVIAAAPSPAAATFPVPAPAPVPVPVPTPEPPAPPVVVAAPSPAPALPAPPPPAKVIPASAVQYLEPIELVYPRVSKRLGETGRVLVRVFIDTAGAAKNVQVERSSGHSRLDEAAVSAVQKARFKPYTENGQAVPGWAFIPLEFELEK